MMFKELKLKDYLMFIVLLCIGYLYTVSQKYFIPEIILLRTLLLLVVTFTLFLVFFLVVRPVQPLRLSKTLSLLLGVVVALIIIVQHFVITFTPSFKNLIVLAISVAVPFISGWIYGILNHSRKEDSNTL